MIGLIIGTIVVGGLMGLISVSLQFSHRVKEKSLVQPVLESAAQEIIANPEKALDGGLTMTDLPGAPPIQIQLAQVTGSDGEVLKNRTGELYRITLSSNGQVLEFSLIIPRKRL
jgi:hypothetical protein